MALKVGDKVAAYQETFRVVGTISEDYHDGTVLLDLADGSTVIQHRNQCRKLTKTRQLVLRYTNKEEEMKYHLFYLLAYQGPFNSLAEIRQFMLDECGEDSPGEDDFTVIKGYDVSKGEIVINEV